jgi:hypothetical protein
MGRETRWGKVGLEETTRGGNKGGQIGKTGRGREEERGEPGAAAPEQAGLSEKKT